MIKTLLTTTAIVLVTTAASFAAPMGSAALKTLATTGASGDYASEIGGSSYDKIGGNPTGWDFGAINITLPSDALIANEFFAPHVAVAQDGTVTVMVAPHLFVGGEVVHGAGPNDSFVVVAADGSYERFDYSDDIAMAPAPSTALYTLATTGAAGDYAAKIGGTFYDEIGGSPVAFEYSVATPWQSVANTLLADGEFLAPHFAVSADGSTITLMVAPHLFSNGELMKGAGPDDSFIVIKGDSAERFDYSVDVATSK